MLKNIYKILFLLFLFMLLNKGGFQEKWRIPQDFLRRKGNQHFGNYRKMSKSPKTQEE